MSILRDVEVGPGDQVQVLDPPTRIAWGERYAVERQATASRASWVGPSKTFALARFELDPAVRGEFLRPAFLHSAQLTRGQHPAVLPRSVTSTGGPQR
jgi:hypothetical protein